MATELTFEAMRLPPECVALRAEVRAFLAKEIEAGTFDPHGGTDAYSEEFSRKVGAKGWIGMTWPKKYGGHERSFLERFVVTEEFRVANAPVRLHFTADRQSGPVIIRYGSERIKNEVLPRICKGEVCFGIGMSEPNSGSDLFAAKTKATKTKGGWLINGTKIWTSNAHQAHYLIGLFRTSRADQGEPSARAHAVRGRHEDAGHHRQSGLPDDRGARLQRGGVPGRLHARRLRGRRDRRRLEAGDERAGLRAQRARAVPGDVLRADCSWWTCWARSPTPAAPRASAGWWRRCTRCGACRCRWRACCTPARSRWCRRPSSRTSAPSGSRSCRTRRATSPPSWPRRRPTTPPSRSGSTYATMIAPKLTIQGGTTEILRGIIARGLGLR